MKAKLIINAQTHGKYNKKCLQKECDQNKRSLKDLYRISKFVYRESFLEGALQTVGKEKILDDPDYAKTNQTMLKIISAFMLAILNIFSVFSLNRLTEIMNYVNEMNFNSFLFAISSINSLNCSIQLLYLFVFGLTGLMGLFGGKAFKTLETLPLNRKEIEKIVFFTFYRTMDYQLIVMFLGLPIVTMIFTGSIIATLAALLVSGFHLMFGVSILIFISNIMAKIFNMEYTSRRKNILKMSISFLYVLMTVSIGLIFTFVGDMVETLFMQNVASGESGYIINAIFSFVPYPFALNYFYGISLFPANKFYLDQAWPSILGFIISTIVIILVFRKSLTILRSVSKEVEVGSERKTGIEELPIVVEKLPPIKAIYKKDLKYATRHFTATMYILMPIFFPFMIIFMMGSNLALEPTEVRFMLNIMVLVYMGMGLMWTFMAAIGSESDTGGLIQTLPINNSDIYRAKRKFLLIFMFIANLAPTIYQLIMLPNEFISILVNFSAIMIITFYGTELILLLYSRLFGKIRNNYTLLELNPERKIDKAILIMVVIYIIIALPLLVTVLLGKWVNPEITFGISSEMYWIELLVSIGIFAIIRYTAFKIFG